MELSKEAIEEFKRLSLKEEGIQLTNEQAVEYGIKLVRFVKAGYGVDLPKLKGLDTGTKNGDNESVLT